MTPLVVAEAGAHAGEHDRGDEEARDDVADVRLRLDRGDEGHEGEQEDEDLVEEHGVCGAVVFEDGGTVVWGTQWARVKGCSGEVRFGQGRDERRV